MKTLGNKISQCRKDNNLTQEALAEKLNVSPQAVSKWENDQSVPDINILVALSDLFAVSLDWLLKQTDEEYKPLQEQPAKPKKPGVLYIDTIDKTGRKTNLKVPFAMLKFGMKLTNNVLKNNEEFKNIDFEEISRMVEEGFVGTLLDVVEEDGETVKIYVE